MRRAIGRPQTQPADIFRVGVRLRGAIDRQRTADAAFRQRHHLGPFVAHRSPPAAAISTPQLVAESQQLCLPIMQPWPNLGSGEVKH